MPDPIRTLRPTVLALALAAGALAGCERDENTRSAVHLAGEQFASTSVGNANGFRDRTRETYQQIIDAMSPLAGEEDGYAQASAVTLAQARLGLAAHAAHDAAIAETEALRRGRVIRGLLSEYLVLAAVAEAASRFSPDADLTELDRLVDARRADARTYEAQKAEIDAQIAELEARTAELRARAAEQRDLAGELTLRMTGVNAQRAAELAAEAREHTLRADQLELEAVRIDGRIGQLRPTAAEIDLNNQKARSQVQQLVRSQEELRERTRAAQEDAAEARAAAAEARDRLAALARDLAEHREQAVAPASDRVHSTLSQAEAALRDARGATQSSATVTRAMVHETAGSAWARRAAGHLQAARVYESLQDAGVPGPHAQNAQNEREAAAAAQEQADEAYAAAADALRSVRARGAAADQINDAARRLDRLAGIEPEPEPGEPADWDETGDTEQTGLEGLSPEDLENMTLEELEAMIPEDMRDTVMEPLRTQLEMLESIDDPDMLREMIAQLEEQAAAMPAEFAIGVRFVQRQIQNRIDEIESGG